MLPEQRSEFPALIASLKDGRAITVRLLEPTDGDALAQFYEGVHRGDFRFYCPHALDAEEAHRKVQGRADADGFVCMVGVDGNFHIVGYAWYGWDVGKPQLSEFGICIARTHQGVGLGKALMTRLFEIAVPIGPPRMCLTVQKENVKAVRLYQKMGFVIVREQECPARFGFAAEPEYAMERDTR